MTGDRPDAPGPGRGQLALHLDEGGIARVCFGARDGRPASLGLSTLEELSRILSELEPLIAEQRVRTLLLAGEGTGLRVAGTDLEELGALPDAASAVAWSSAGQAIVRRLEELPIPTIAAIDGPCLEAGLELALACSYRLASDAPATRLGLSQIRLGMIPGFGGTVRLPRLLGLQQSLELILTGNALDAERALAIGLVDELLPARQFQVALERFAEARLRTGRIRSGARRRLPRRLLEETAPGRRLVVRGAARRLLPTPEQRSSVHQHALHVVAGGTTLPLAEAFRREAEAAGTLIVSGPSAALRHALRILQEARRAPATPPDTPVQRVGVLGAGTVGSEIAYLLTAAELPILLKDRRRDAVLRGSQHLRNLLARDSSNGEVTASSARLRGDLVSPAAGFGGFGTLDLVLAAVGHAPEAAEEALREVEEHTRPDCVLACTSLTLSPTRVQHGMEHPERVVGLRFSRPTDLFELLEIVPGAATGQRAIDSCLDLAARLGRAAILAPDVVDTPGSRLLGIFLAEALRLLEEGATVGEVDRAMDAFGFALSPFRRMDAMGVDRCVRLLERLHEACGERMAPSRIVRRLSGSPALFYRYARGLPQSANPGLPAGIPAPGSGFSEPTQIRILLALVNEAALTLQQFPSVRPTEVDVAAIAGLGFPRSHGGILYYADRTGIGRLVDWMGEYAGRFGRRFEPAPLLQELAVEGRSFYGAPTGQGAPGVLR